MYKYHKVACFLLLAFLFDCSENEEMHKYQGVTERDGKIEEVNGFRFE